MAPLPAFETLRIDLEGPVARVRLNRPQAANALDLQMWAELPRAFDELATRREVRVILLSGEGKHFTAGIDISAIEWLQTQLADAARPTRGREKIHAFIEHAQNSFNAIERNPVPVIAAIHGACIGGGVDLIAACDIRLCTRDARFSIKEIDLAVVPDVGTLQRLRHVIGYSALTELTYTAEMFDGARARELGLVSRVFDDAAALMSAAGEMAQTIAAKPPGTARGIKRNLLWAREHSVQDGLAYTAAWNAAMLVGEELQEALAARAQKREARFVD